MGQLGVRNRLKQLDREVGRRADADRGDANLPWVLFRIIDEFRKGFPRRICLHSNHRRKEIMESQGLNILGRVVVNNIWVSNRGVDKGRSSTVEERVPILLGSNRCLGTQNRPRSRLVVWDDLLTDDLLH